VDEKSLPILKQVVNRFNAEFFFNIFKEVVSFPIFRKCRGQTVRIVNKAAEDVVRRLPYIVDKPYIRGHAT
jgi:uncharacterized FlaG/YvyC family protein